MSRTPIAALLVTLAAALAWASAGLAQAPPASPPLKATILLGAGAPADGVFSTNAPVPIVVQIENVSGGNVATTEGFASTDFFRRLYFTDPLGGIVTNKVEEQIHTDSRLFMCLSRRGVLQRPAIPVAPIEVLAGPGASGNFFREYTIDDARRFYDLSRPGRYSVNARIPLLVFTLSDPGAVIDDCDQLPGLVAANVAALTGRAEFTIVSNTLEFEVNTPPPAPPVTTASVSPGPNASGWTTASVSVSFTATSPSNVPIQRIVVQTAGAQPGQQSFPGAKGVLTISADGQTAVAYHAEDSAGGIEAAQLLTLRIDTSPPFVTCEAPDPAWRATDVTLACTASDPASGLANASDASFSLSTAVPASTETSSATTESRVVCDVAGHCVSKTVGGIRIDKRAPASAVTTPAAGAVYDVGQAVLAAYACTDGGAGVASCAGPVASGSRIDTDTPGPKTFTVTAVDFVGNTASASVSYTVKSPDAVPPTTTATASPGANANGWNNTDVTVTLTAVDNPGGSGVKEVTYALSGAQTGGATTAGDSATVSLTAEGTTTVTYSARDNAGNAEAAKTLVVRLDRTRPTLAGLPAPGCSLWPPNGALVRVASVTATDALSGVGPGALVVTATSDEPVQSGDIVISGAVVQLRARRLGSGDGRTYTITATATDRAGNTTTATSTCTVPHDQGKK